MNNYFDKLYLELQKERLRKNERKYSECEYVHFKISNLSLDIFKSVNIDAEKFKFGFSLQNFTIYDKLETRKFFLFKSQNLNSEEKLLMIKLKSYIVGEITTIELLDIKILPTAFDIELSTISFIYNFLNTSVLAQSKNNIINQDNQLDYNIAENNESMSIILIKNVIIHKIEFKINTRFNGKNNTTILVFRKLVPLLLRIQDNNVEIKQFFKEKEDPLEVLIDELNNFYYSQLTSYENISQTFASIRSLRPIGDYINGIINVFRLPIKYYIKGDGVFYGIAHGVGNLVFKFSRGTMQLCKNVYYD